MGGGGGAVETTARHSAMWPWTGLSSGASVFSPVQEEAKLCPAGVLNRRPWSAGEAGRADGLPHLPLRSRLPERSEGVTEEPPWQQPWPGSTTRAPHVTSECQPPPFTFPTVPPFPIVSTGYRGPWMTDRTLPTQPRAHDWSRTRHHSLLMAAQHHPVPAPLGSESPEPANKGAADMSLGVAQCHCSGPGRGAPGPGW